MSEIDLSKYLEMDDEELEELTSNSIAPPKGTKTYMFKVTDFEVRNWEDGRCSLNVRTEVAEGDHKGQSGPFMNLSLHPFIREEEEVDEEEMAKRRETAQGRFVKRLKTLADGETPVLPSGEEETVLKAAGEMVKGKEFIASVRRGDNGYAQFSNYYPLSKPPKNFEREVEAFTL